ncbi:MAG: tetratricopeptide repeat protein [Treponema sp.]|jgi:tetratricopeptide (TPR) repeat protein|nr:tetratricopeptide repeat protein [Treponema sp.]
MEEVAVVAEAAAVSQEGIALFQKGDWKNALEFFLKTRPENTDEILESAYYTGLCYAKLKCFEEAQPYLEKYIANAQNSVRVYQCRMTLAYAYIMTKKARKAEYELTVLINSGFESAQLYATMAYAAWSRQSYGDAIASYERALSIDSQNLTALNGLGFILADTDKDVKRGLRFCKRAVEKKPGNPVYLDSLGWAYYKNGKRIEAIKFLLKAREKDPDNPFIREHLKMVEAAK